jgi:hypothetical protein
MELSFPIRQRIVFHCCSRRLANRALAKADPEMLNRNTRSAHPG